MAIVFDGGACDALVRIHYDAEALVAQCWSSKLLLDVEPRHALVEAIEDADCTPRLAVVSISVRTMASVTADERTFAAAVGASIESVRERADVAASTSRSCSVKLYQTSHRPSGHLSCLWSVFRGCPRRPDE